MTVPVRARAALWLAVLCWKPGMEISWWFTLKKGYKQSGDGWVIQSHVSSWQSTLSLIAASVTVEGRESCSRYSNPNAKPDIITACQITVRLHTSSPPAFLNSLSGTRFRILTHIFIWSLCLSFLNNLWSNFVFGFPQIRSHLNLQTSCLSKCYPA